MVLHDLEEAMLELDALRDSLTSEEYNRFSMHLKRANDAMQAAYSEQVAFFSITAVADTPEIVQGKAYAPLVRDAVWLRTLGRAFPRLSGDKEWKTLLVAGFLHDRLQVYKLSHALYALLLTEADLWSHIRHRLDALHVTPSVLFEGTGPTREIILERCPRSLRWMLSLDEKAPWPSRRRRRGHRGLPAWQRHLIEVANLHGGDSDPTEKLCMCDNCVARRAQEARDVEMELSLLRRSETPVAEWGIDSNAEEE